MHDDDDDQIDDDQPLTQDEIAAQYGFKPGEREAIAAEMAERQRRIDRDETLAWVKRQADARLIPEAVTKSAPVTRPRPAAAVTSSMSKEWQSYIDARIKRESRAADECMAKAIGQTIGKTLGEMDRSNAALLERVAKLEIELAEIRGELRGRAAAEAEQTAPRAGLRAV